MDQNLGVALNVTAWNALTTPTAMTRLLSGPAKNAALVPSLPNWMPSITSIIASDVPSGAANLNGSFSTPVFPAAPAFPSYANLGDAIPANPGTFTFNATPKFSRPALPADYEALKFTTTISDPDGVRFVTCPGAITNPNPTATATACASPSTILRFGMLKLDNAYGSELLPLYMTARAKFWDRTIPGWADNPLDSCTTIAPANITISNYTGNLTTVTIPAATTTLASGVGSLKFKVAAPVAGTVGSADIAINLGAAGVGDTSCIPAAKKLAVGGAYTGGAAMTWLRGNWCGGVGIYATDPSARLTFGTAKSPFLFQRERY